MVGADSSVRVFAVPVQILELRSHSIQNQGVGRKTRLHDAGCVQSRPEQQQSTSAELTKGPNKQAPGSLRQTKGKA